MITFLKRLFFALAVLGGSLIVLFWVLAQLKAHTPAPVSTLAAKAANLMQPQG